MIDEIVQGRQQPLVKQRIDERQVGRVPTDEQYFRVEWYTHVVLQHRVCGSLGKGSLLHTRSAKHLPFTSTRWTWRGDERGAPSFELGSDAFLADHHSRFSFSIRVLTTVGVQYKLRNQRISSPASRNSPFPRFICKSIHAQLCPVIETEALLNYRGLLRKSFWHTQQLPA